MHECMVNSLIFVFCKRYPQTVFHFMLFLRVPAPWFPWAYMGFSVLSGAGVMDMLISVFAANLYLVLKEVAPVDRRLTLLKTPRYLRYLSCLLLCMFREEHAKED